MIDSHIQIEGINTTVTLTDNDFTYNPQNEIGQIAELTQTRAFTYDDVHRLTGMNNGSSNESYAFDGVGNRNSSHRSATYSYQPFNKLTSTATATYSYDANGNMVSKSEGSKFWSYWWDHENRLVYVSDRKTRQRIIYDALGRRVRSFGGPKGATKYTYDGFDVVMDDNSVSGITKYQNGPGIDNKLKLTYGGDAKYFLQDHLGSTIGLADSSGAVVTSASYDSFGNSTNNLATRYQYTGREYDSFSGLYYYRARWYDPNLGRFISEDPIGFRGGDLNLYGYVGNNPLRFIDPFGLQANPFYGACVAGWGALGATVGFVAGGGLGVFAGPGAVAAVPAGAIYGAAGGAAVGAGIGSIACGTPSTTTSCPARQQTKPTIPPLSIPLERAPAQPMPTPDEENCAEEIRDCSAKCAAAQIDPDQPKIYGGSISQCMKNCLSERCGGEPKWKGYKDKPRPKRWKF